MVVKPVFGREGHLKTLETLLGLEVGVPVQSVFVYGDSGSGKTYCVKHALKGHRHIWLNCLEILQPQCAFSAIINHLGIHSELESLNDITKLETCDTPSDFLRLFTQSLPDSEKLYIVFDDANRLRDLDLLTFFLRLQELSKRQVCCIFISIVMFSHLVSTTDFFWPHEIHMPSYNESTLCEILAQSGPRDCRPEFYAGYVKIVVAMFKNVTRNVKELMHIAETNFEHYAAPCKLDPKIEENSLKLWQNIEPYLKKAMDTVYLRDTDSRTGNTDSSKPVKQIIELPFYSKFLLIAAYLASYNPASTDKKFFVKKSNRERRKPNSLRRAKPNYHLLGPRPFPLNRLLAIFHAIVDNPVEPRTTVSSQVSSLVHHKLITQVAAKDPLSAPRYKCCVDFDYITEIARTVKFPVVEHLEDFNM